MTTGYVALYTIGGDGLGIASAATDVSLANRNLALGTGSLTATNLTGTLQTAAQTNVTSLGTLTSLSIAGAPNGTNLLDVQSYPASAGVVSQTSAIRVYQGSYNHPGGGTISSMYGVYISAGAGGETGDIFLGANLYVQTPLFGDRRISAAFEGNVVITSPSVSSAPTLATDLQIHSATQNSSRLTFSGQEFYQAANTSTDGPAFVLGVNRTNNRQLLLVDSTNASIATTTNYALRFIIGSASAAIDAISTDCVTGKLLALGNSGSGVYFPGNVGIGNTPASTIQLYINKTTTATSGALAGLQISSAMGASSGTVSEIDNIYISNNYSNNAGTITNAHGIHIGGGSTAGTITTGIGLSINALGFGTTRYGVYVTAPSGGTNNYTAYFDGGVGIAATNLTTSGYALSVGGRFYMPASLSGSSTTGFISMQNTAAVDSATIRITSLSYVGGTQSYIDFIVNSASDFKSQMAFGVNNGGGAVEAFRIASDGTTVINGAVTAERQLTVRYAGTTGGSLFLDCNNASKTGGTILTSDTRSANSANSMYVAYSSVLSDLEFHLRGDGNAFCDGSWAGGGADYAEYFESAHGVALPVGSTVYLDGDKVRCVSADLPISASLIIGVVRPKGMAKSSVVVGNAGWNAWQGKFLTDGFGAYIMEDHNVVEWSEVDPETKQTTKRSYEDWNIPAGVVVPADAIVSTHDSKGNRYKHRKLNPLYNPNTPYTPREERDEWILIGLLGQIPIRDDQRVHPNWIRLRSVSASVSLWMVR